jgi:uncharacterized protein (TIGR03086 family)
MAGPAAASIAGIALLERATTYTLGSLHLVGRDDLARRTPCRNWDLAALLAHMDDALLALSEALSTGEVGIDPVAAGPGDPVAGLRVRLRGLLGVLAATRQPAEVTVAGRALTCPIVTSTGAVEITVHGWDAGRACGRHHPVPAALAAELLDLAPLLVTDVERPGRFDPPVAVPPAAPPGDRLVAFLGRVPVGG